MSRVAVSRQISDLEQSLGQRLFLRQHRGIALTSAGETLANTVNPALDRIADAMAGMRAYSGRSRLSITATSAFATYWLVPRLSDFGRMHPEIGINLVVSDRYLDLAAEGIDIAIRFLPVDEHGTQWQPILRESILPVFSPHYRASTGLRRAEDLLQERLLYLSGSYRADTRWEHWFRYQGLSAPEIQSAVAVNTYVNMLQAAIEGQGVALAGHPLVDRYLADGTLLRIEGIEAMPRSHYHLHVRSKDEPARIFHEWLMRQIAEPDPLVP